VQKSIYGQTQTEVRKKLLVMTMDVDAGIYRDPSKLTVGQWLDTWKKEYLLNVRPSTAHLYTQQIRLYLNPAFGETKLCKLDSATIQKKYRELSDKLSPKSVKNVHGIFHKALEQAVKNGYIKFNPSNACELPKIEKQDICPLSDEQQKAFLRAIEGHVHEDLYKVDLFTGMREGELLGLMWDCVDFQRGTILIDKQLRKDQKMGGEYYFSPPKNGKSRILTPAPFVMDILKAHKVKQTEQRLKLGPVWDNSGLVFTNETGGRLSYRTAYDCFKRIVAQIGAPKARFHDLRHTYAVNAIRAGDDIKTIQGNLGHATAAFTLNVYAHFTSEMQQDSAQRMDSYAKRLFNL
jgi:Site-specific recombinase XerD